MRTVEEHRAALVGLVSALPPVTVGLAESLGRVLAADVVAAVDLPGFDNSAMDGYAVRSAGTSASPSRPRTGRNDRRAAALGKPRGIPGRLPEALKKVASFARRLIAKPSDRGAMRRR